MTRKFTKYPSNYVRANIDTSKYEVVGFTPAEYERLKSFNGGSDNTFGYIKLKGAPYAIDVSYDIMPQWTVYELGRLDEGSDVAYNNDIEIGAMDLSLTYEDQLDFLVDKLNEVSMHWM